MKKLTVIMSAAAAIVALASCTKDMVSENPVQASGSSLTFVAGFDVTKTAMDENLKTTWKSGDIITVFDAAGNTEQFTVPAADEGKSTTTITTTTIPAGSDAYYAAYGSGDCGMDGGRKVIALGTPDGKWGSSHAALAKAKDGVFNFENASAVICFELGASGVKSVGFKAPKGFCNKAYFDYDESGKYTLTKNTSITTDISTDAAGKYYFGAFPDTLESVTITLDYVGTKSAATEEITISTPVILKAGTVLNLGKLEGRATKTYKRVSRTGFATASDDIDDDGAFTYAAVKGNASTAPGVYNSCIRLYQAPAEGNYGGYLDVVSTTGDKIAGVTITTGATCSCKTVIQDASEAFDYSKASEVAESSSYGVGNLNANKVRIYCCGANSSHRLNIASIEVTYVEDKRASQELSFPKDSYTAILGKSFTAPAVSGAQTSPVTYTSTDTTVATVDASTGTVSLIAAGTCTITATAPESAEYKEGTASYELTVAAGVDGIAGIKTLAASSTAATFVATLADAIVTEVGTLYSNQIGFIQDATGGIYLYLSSSSGQLVQGAKISGTVSGKTAMFNGVKEITELNLGEATVASGAELPLRTVTIAELNTNYSVYEYCRVKIEDALVTDAMASGSDAAGSIKQGENSVATYSNKKDINLDLGSTVDIICYPSYFKESKQVIIWNQTDITSKSGPNTITMATSKTLSAGDTWTIGATCLSGDAVTYEVTVGDDIISITDGVVTAIKEGTATIKATSIAKGIYTAATAECAVTVNPSGGATFTKVTSEPADWSGEYVLAAVADEKALVWTCVDAAKCHGDSLAITDNTIKGTFTSSIIIAKMEGGYSIKVNGGEKDKKYISAKITSSAIPYDNGLSFNDSASFPIEIQMTTSGSVDIWQVTTKEDSNKGKKVYLLYNSSKDNQRFRFYKDSNKSNSNYLAPALFKKN